jgi:hypothetical protein
MPGITALQFVRPTSPPAANPNKLRINTIIANIAFPRRAVEVNPTIPAGIACMRASLRMAVAVDPTIPLANVVVRALGAAPQHVAQYAKAVTRTYA